MTVWGRAIILEQYAVAETVMSGSISYSGFTNSSGEWYILKDDLTDGSKRYVRGKTDFVTNWTNHASLSYDYFHVVFEGER